MNRLFVVLTFMTVFGCVQQSQEETVVTGKVVEVRYAKGFTLTRTDTGLVLEIQRPFPGANESIRYDLLREGEEGIRRFPFPVKRIVCTSTTHIPMLDYLGEEASLVGFPNLDYISTPSVRRRIESGEVAELGNVVDMNRENLIMADPQVIVSYSMDDLSIMDQLENMGFQVILNGDYLEDHPLGRAEWIKVFGALTGKLDMADSIFRAIEKDYLELVEIAEESNHPCVFSGSLYGDSWYMPATDNYAARLLEDAGYTYVVESDTTSGFLRWGFENIYELARDCDYWLSPAPFADLRGLGEADERYRQFSAYRSGNVYVYDNKIGPTGGNEYLELGYLRPDIVLKDLIHIRDQTLMPDHDLYFYRKLR